jgi:hypothetical protein
MGRRQDSVIFKAHEEWTWVSIAVQRTLISSHTEGIDARPVRGTGRL